MQKWRNILLCAAVSFMFLFMAVGYAQLSDHLAINGTANVQELKAVYIKSISVIYSNNVTNTPVVTKNGNVTFIHSDYTLNHKPRNSTTAGGQIQIEVTVKNNSGKPQYFSELTALDTTTNAYKTFKEYCHITYRESGENLRIEDGQTKTYLITIQNTKQQTKQQNFNLNMKDFVSLLVFTPKLDVNDTINATQSLAKAFANVLAGKGPNGDYGSIFYKGKEITADKIMAEITKKMTDVETGGYTGNVGNATQDEKDLMEAIFGDNIVLQIGANYYSVYILIKNQQIDGKGENDMVIYVTADQLDVGGGEWKNNKWQNTHIVPVYALVFIKDGNSYKYCDHLFAGEAPVCDFGGALGDGKIGNFHTNIWNSTEFSSVTDQSGGSIGQQYITTNGELDEAYKYFIDRNPNSLIDPGTLQ